MFAVLVFASHKEPIEGYWFWPAISQKLFWVSKICKNQLVANLKFNKLRSKCENKDLPHSPYLNIVYKCNKAIRILFRMYINHK